MDILTQAEKLQSALRELDLLQSSMNGAEAENVERLQDFFSVALGEIWTELLAESPRLRSE